jgi:hypothetical protein
MEITPFAAVVGPDVKEAVAADAPEIWIELLMVVVLAPIAPVVWMTPPLLRRKGPPLSVYPNVEVFVAPKVIPPIKRLASTVTVRAAVRRLLKVAI